MKARLLLFCFSQSPAGALRAAELSRGFRRACGTAGYSLCGRWCAGAAASIYTCLPEGSQAPRCLIHGGGWKSGSKAGCPAKGMLASGFAAASIE